MPKDVKAVSKVIVKHGVRMLMLQREDGKGWELPGGHLNVGEKYISGAKREVFEETKIKLSKFKALLRQKDFCLFVSVAKTTKVTLSNEHIDFRWVNKHQFKKLNITDATKMNVRHILNAI